VILTVGRLVGAEDRARTLVGEYEQRLAERAHGPKRGQLVLACTSSEWCDPMVSGIRWVSELIEAVGGDDISQTAPDAPWPRDRQVAPDEVIARRPESVLARWCGKPFDRFAFEARSGFDDLPAVRSGGVHEVDPSIILQPGPAFADRTA